MAGVAPNAIEPPEWLFPHQRDAVQRLASALVIFRGALLADATGLGKTYVALALAARMGETIVLAPAAILHQWRRTAARLDLDIRLVSHEALSRGGAPGCADLVIVDEAHRFRNPGTRRYDALATGIGSARLLLLTATPVVNRSRDLVHLVRLFLADHALAPLGVRSLEQALADRDDAALMHALMPMIVARAAETALPGVIPATHDAPVCRAPTLPPGSLDMAIRMVDELAFPAFGPSAPDLLRLHLLYRLSSSVAAALKTIDRHLAFVVAALAAARRGEHLPRSAARQIIERDQADQFTLDMLFPPDHSVDTRALLEERDRLNRIRPALTTMGVCDPKAEACRTLLERRRGRKTIVFTTARATALHLAQHIGWTGLAVVSGGGARIASGNIPMEETLGLFAPRAQGRGAPPPSLVLDTLVATGVASEGLDLQDADAIVHYDLPWHPLALAQRLGRIARLGSEHGRVQVFWFAPPEALDRRLKLEARIRAKLRKQMSLGVPQTARVGRTCIVNSMLDARERLVAAGNGSHSTGVAVVDAQIPVLVALRWKTQHGAVTSVCGIDADGSVIVDSRIIAQHLHLGRSATELKAGAIGPLNEVLKLVRRRMACAERGPANRAARLLARRVLTHARRAAKRRDVSLVAVLDRVLQRIDGGLAVGDERTLSGLLGGRVTARSLEQWLGRTPDRRICWELPSVTAALLPGDASNPRNSGGA